MQAGVESQGATPEELEALVEQVRPALDEAGHPKLKAAVRTLTTVTALIGSPQTTIESLRSLLRAPRTEKTAAVLKRSGVETNLFPSESTQT